MYQACTKYRFVGEFCDKVCGVAVVLKSTYKQSMIYNFSFLILFTYSHEYVAFLSYLTVSCCFHSIFCEEKKHEVKSPSLCKFCEIFFLIIVLTFTCKQSIRYCIPFLAIFVRRKKGFDIHMHTKHKCIKYNLMQVL